VDLNLTADQEEFRDEVRTWLSENVPKEARPDDKLEGREFDKAWQRTQYDAGWAGIAWPTEFGGRGLDLIEQLIWYEEYAHSGAPDVGTSLVGLTQAGPTLTLKGSPEQRQEHLGAILRGETVWCQGFSEPEAGSDLASLRTRGRVDGDHFVVSGRKIWTSYADLADFQELLVRTDPDQARHKGISWVICDMHAPGIDVQPIETVHGERHFCEVTYDDVRIPLSHVVGGLHDGWQVAMTTLSFERGSAFIADQIRLARQVEKLIAFAKRVPAPDGRRRAIEDDELRRRLGRIRAEVAALRAMTYANVSRVVRQGRPGPESSMVRLYYSQAWQQLYRLAVDVSGDSALALDRQSEEGRWTWEFLNSLRATIAAGTKDIQRNIIGERLLGLPRG
jgi:alkylation response protein AidB-like acyl-CoA dehydrogenase